MNCEMLISLRVQEELRKQIRASDFFRCSYFFCPKSNFIMVFIYKNNKGGQKYENQQSTINSESRR